LTLAERNKFFSEHTAITKLRSDWKKGYAVTKTRFLALTPSFIPDLRYDRVTKQFIGLAQWSESLIRNGEEVSLINQQEIILSKAFVAENFKPDVIEYVKKATVRGGSKFLQVPEVNIMLDTRAVTHVKYSVSTQFPEGRFVVQFSDGDVRGISTDEAEKLFEQPFLEIVKKFGKTNGFINVPPGDSKPKCTNAISCNRFPIHFHQQGKQTCVCSSFASALWAVGLQSMAHKVAELASTMSETHSVLHQVGGFMSKTWLQPVKISPKKKRPWPYPLLTADLQNAIALVVLVASDGSRSHAITVHDGLIFDSNEDFALTLCQENLDALCSTPLRQSTFKAVATGYIFRDQKNEDRIKKHKAASGNPWII
jgi:hypothetical protein